LIVFGGSSIGSDFRGKKNNYETKLVVSGCWFVPWTKTIVQISKHIMSRLACRVVIFVGIHVCIWFLRKSIIYLDLNLDPVWMRCIWGTYLEIPDCTIHGL